MQRLHLRGLVVFITMSLALLVAACGNTTISIVGSNGGNGTPSAGGGQPTATPGLGSQVTPTPTHTTGGTNTPTPTPTPTHADGSSNQFFHVATAATIHTTSDNSTHASTYLDNTTINNNPNVMIEVTPNWSHNGNAVYDNHVLGVWYDTVIGRWAIYHEDESPMQANAVYNVHVAYTQNANFFILTTSSGAIAGDYVATNVTDPSALLWVTHSFDPNGTGPSTLHNHALGVWYNNGHWNIFNEDRVTMVAGVSFNVIVQPNAAAIDFQHVVTAGNSSDDFSVFSNALTASQPTKLVFVTPVWHTSTDYDIHPLGVWFTNNQWSVFNEDGSSAMPVNLTLNVLVANS